MLRPIERKIALVTATLAALIIYTQFFFPAFLPDYIPDECKPAENPTYEPCSYLYVALSPVPRILEFIGDDQHGLGRYLEAFFIGLTALFTATLWWTTRQLVGGANDTARRQLRAYVNIQKTQITGIESATVEVTFDVVNNGNTPAYKLLCVATIFVDDPRSPRVFGLGSTTPPVLSVLGPSGGQSQTVSPHPPLTADDLKPVLSGEKAIFMQGVITYEDVFGEPRRIGFERVKVKKRDGMGSPAMNIGPHGDTAD